MNILNLVMYVYLFEDKFLFNTNKLSIKYELSIV